MAQTSKCLFVFLEGVLMNYHNPSSAESFLLEQSKHKEMDRICRLGGTTLIHTRKLTHSDFNNSLMNTDTAYMMQLFDYYDPIQPEDDEEEESWKKHNELRLEKQSLFCKYKKLKVQTWTTNASVLQIFCNRKDKVKLVSDLFSSDQEDALVENAASAMLENDILLLHDNVSKLETSQKVLRIEHADQLIKKITEKFSQMQQTTPALKVYHVLLFSCPFNETMTSQHTKSLFKPLQSYQQKNGQNISHLVFDEPSMICVQYCEEETRRDNNEHLTEKSCLENAGNSSILVDFILAEVAYKLRKSPKYGA
ncbi:hypothetical protein C9374_000743 [Naegleria lovaniensis]|uniref:Uncharacterized protein n=1 Tax=Naegleria lovaniensis TaxID=51637 RepID=A0AA88KMS8_NAELO|nr:uncharacterized protein C9374_000743 [Naegleria lovaniensis]KAG2387893.1 hypothetical protein C9374_000743 [Naegleria lovaniensis]